MAAPVTSSGDDRGVSCGQAVELPAHGNAGQPAAHLPNAERVKGCTATVRRAVQSYTKPHVCKPNIVSFYHQARTTCKHELCKAINYLIVRGSSCRGGSEDTASGSRGNPRMLRVCVHPSYGTAALTGSSPRAPGDPALSN